MASQKQQEKAEIAQRFEEGKNKERNLCQENFLNKENMTAGGERKKSGEESRTPLTGKGADFFETVTAPGKQKIRGKVSANKVLTCNS